MRYFLIIFCLCLASFSVSAHEDKESVFDRILRSGKIECGYYVFPPVTNLNAEGELEGLSVDMMNEIASRAGLEVEWKEEISFGNWAPALQSDRFDLVCTPMWPEIPMTRTVYFSEPMFFAGLSPMVRVNDKRFHDENFDRLNKGDVKFVTLEGNAIDTLTRATFPNAKIYSMPSTTDGPTMLQEIVTKKADATLLDRNGEIYYNKNNPVKLKLVQKENPVKVQPFTLVIRRGEHDLLHFVDNAIRELRNDKTIDRLLEKWEPEPFTYLRASIPYGEIE